MKEEMPLSLNIRRYSDYLLEPDEMVLFEWFLFKQNGYGWNYRFFFSREKIECATRIKRRRVEAIIKRFVDLGFLTKEVGEENGSRMKVTYYGIDAEVLRDRKVLSQILRAESLTFKELSQWLRGK